MAIIPSPGRPDPRGYPTIERLERDTRQVIQFVESATGLVSRWTGVVRIVSDVDTNKEPYFYGRKLQTCPIEYHQAVLGGAEIYWVYLEEALHSVSVMPVSSTVLRRNFENMEESVVSACIEILKKNYNILFQQDTIPMATVPPMIIRSPYEAEMQALGRLRRRTALNHQEFYFGLLSTPLDEREQWIRQQIVAQERTSKHSLLTDAMVDGNFQLLRRR